MQKELSLAVATASAAIFLTACGDENTTNITETTGIAVVAAGDSLPACGEENVGEIVFAEDSAQVYYCADGKWTTLKGEQGEQGETGEAGADGKDGENGSDGSSCTATPVDGGIEARCDGEVVGVIANGKDGTDGEVGSDGKGCTAEAIENGYKILCGGDSIGVLLNGEQGEQGIQGEKGEQGEKGLDGASCTAVALEDNSGFNVICGGDTIGVLKNGEKGETGENGSGCKIADQGDGVVEVTCGEGENASTTTLYKAMCGAAAYDPATQICADNQIVSVCSEALDGEKITVNGISYQCWEQKWIEEKENWQYLNPAISYEMFKDARDGQIYKSVKIGNQVWMAENLNYDYNEGTAKSYCYNDEQESCAKYGRLYTWAAAMRMSPEQSSSPRVVGTIMATARTNTAFPCCQRATALTLAITTTPTTTPFPGVVRSTAASMRTTGTSSTSTRTCARSTTARRSGFPFVASGTRTRGGVGPPLLAVGKAATRILPTIFNLL